VLPYEMISIQILGLEALKKHEYRSDGSKKYFLELMDSDLIVLCLLYLKGDGCKLCIFTWHLTKNYHSQNMEIRAQVLCKKILIFYSLFVVSLVNFGWIR